jgi:hypothetical protein
MPYKNKEQRKEYYRKYNAEKRKESSREYGEKMKLRIVNESNHCSGCGVELTEENHRSGLRCRDCYKISHRNSKMKKQYGITLDEYNEMWASQKGCCAICGTHQNEKNDGKSLAVDHNHETGEVRGLLCVNCNTAIGQLKDDPELLLKAVDYLRGR